MRAALAEQNLPGLSVAVGVNGDIVWAEGFGWADLEKRVPVAPETRFRIGTASRRSPGRGRLLLERGALKLDDEIQTYVPEFPEKEGPVTLRQLMGHIAGSETTAATRGRCSAPCSRRVDALPHFADIRCGSSRGPIPLFELRLDPGERSRRSRLGQTFPDVHGQVFEPLGMDDTMPDTATEPIPDRATAYFPRFAADPRYGLDLMREIDYSCYAGSSAFCPPRPTWCDSRWRSTAASCCNPPPSITPDVTATSSGQETGYGLGWDLETVLLAGKQTRVVGHDGDSLGGMVASLMTFPDHGIVVSVTSNASYAGTAAIAVKIAEGFARQHPPRT